MVKAFDLQAELLSVSQQRKTVHIIFRNPCPDNWASGGRKCLTNGETLELGLCHRVFSISEEDSEIQFLQSLQETYDLVTVFHIAAFAKHLIMTKEGRKILEDLLKEDGEETIKELSTLAVKFVCIEKCDDKIFIESLSKEIAEKKLHFKTLAVCGLATCMLGALVAVLAALQAKSTKEFMAVTHDKNIQHNVAFKNDAGDTEVKLNNSLSSDLQADPVSDFEKGSAGGSSVSLYNNSGPPEIDQAEEMSGECAEKETITCKKVPDAEIAVEGITTVSVSKQHITVINDLNRQVHGMEPVFPPVDSNQDTPIIDNNSIESNILNSECSQLLQKTITDSPMIANLQGSITPNSGSDTAEVYPFTTNGMENSEGISTLPSSPSNEENTAEELSRTQDLPSSIDPNADETVTSPGNNAYLIMGAVIAVFIAFGVMLFLHVF